MSVAVTLVASLVGSQLPSHIAVAFAMIVSYDLSIGSLRDIGASQWNIQVCIARCCLRFDGGIARYQSAPMLVSELMGIENAAEVCHWSGYPTKTLHHCTVLITSMVSII